MNAHYIRCNKILLKYILFFLIFLFFLGLIIFGKIKEKENFQAINLANVNIKPNLYNQGLIYKRFEFVKYRECRECGGGFDGECLWTKKIENACKIYYYNIILEDEVYILETYLKEMNDGSYSTSDYAVYIKNYREIKKNIAQNFNYEILKIKISNFSNKNYINFKDYDEDYYNYDVQVEMNYEFEKFINIETLNSLLQLNEFNLEHDYNIVFADNYKIYLRHGDNGYFSLVKIKDSKYSTDLIRVELKNKDDFTILEEINKFIKKYKIEI